MMDTFAKWCQEYGKVFGVYFFREPVLMTTDVDVIKEVFVRHFDQFPATGLIHPLSQYPTKGTVSFTEGETWKRQRIPITPSFSANKIKLMRDFIAKCCSNVEESIRESIEKGEPVDITNLFGAYTLDVIAGVGFGIEINSLKEIKDNVFLNTLRHMVRTNEISKAYAVASIFPFTAPILRFLGFRRSSTKDVEYVLQTIRGLVDDRKKDSEGRPDLLQQLVQAEASMGEIKENPQAKRMLQS